MVEATHDATGGMDISDQRSTFHGFLIAALWGCTLIAQSVALLTVGFAIGAGWWAGMIAFVAIGAVVGLLFKMSSTYWATQVALFVLMAIGGVVIPALSGMMG
jgi:Bacterial aa3 type cytochrome c oxidase subunit IV